MKKYWTDEEKEILQKMVNRAEKSDFLNSTKKFLKKVQKELKRERSLFSIEKGLRRYTDFYEQRKRFLKDEGQIQDLTEASKMILKLQTDLTKTKRKLKLVEKVHKEALDKLGRIEDLKGEIERVAAFPPARVRPVTIGKKKRPRESAVLLLSDIHLGEIVKNEETAGLGEYNIRIALDRLWSIQESVIDISQRILGDAYNFDELVILGLGDWVSGYIHPDLYRTNELPVVEQSYLLAYVIAQIIQKFAQVFPKIRVRALSGNHSRLQEKIVSKERWVTWDYNTALFLKEMLRQQRNVEVTPLKSFIDFIRIKGHTFAILHGDEIRAGGVTPYYGISRAMYRLMAIEEREFRDSLRELKSKGAINNKTFLQELQALKYLVDYTILAHFHEFSELLGGSIIINGSVIGPNEYSLSKSLGGPPSQLFFGVHPERGKSWQYNLDLRNPPKFQFQLPPEIKID